MTASGTRSLQALSAQVNAIRLVPFDETSVCDQLLDDQSGWSSPVPYYSTGERGGACRHPKEHGPRAQGDWRSAPASIAEVSVPRRLLLSILDAAGFHHDSHEFSNQLQI